MVKPQAMLENEGGVLTFIEKRGKLVGHLRAKKPMGVN